MEYDRVEIKKRRSIKWKLERLHAVSSKKIWQDDYRMIRHTKRTRLSKRKAKNVLTHVRHLCQQGLSEENEYKLKEISDLLVGKTHSESPDES